jgi:hypothetical protein
MLESMGRWALVIALALVCGCGRIGLDYLQHGASDAAVARHVAVDAGFDAARSVVHDGGTDAALRVDAGLDAAPHVDASFDAGRHSARDAGTDAATDLDAGADDASLAPVLPPPGDFCEAVHPLAAPPLIDGVLEPGLSLRTISKAHWVGLRAPPADQEAAYAVAYRPDGVYVFVAVTDSTRLPALPADYEFCGDAVEIYLDSDGAFPMAPSYDVPGTVQFVAAAPVDAVTPAMRASRWNNVTFLLGSWTSSEFGTFPSATGYSFEAIFRAADLGLVSWTLSPGDSIGLSVAIDVAVQPNEPGAVCGDRLDQYFNRIDTTSGLACGVGAYCSTYAFCSAGLLP